jgi:hypothetical protein
MHLVSDLEQIKKLHNVLDLDLDLNSFSETIPLFDQDLKNIILKINNEFLQILDEYSQITDQLNIAMFNSL